MAVYLAVHTASRPSIGELAEFGQRALELGADPGQSLAAERTSETQMTCVVPFPVDPEQANLRLRTVRARLQKVIAAGVTVSPAEVLEPIADLCATPMVDADQLAPVGSRLRALVGDLTRLAAGADVDLLPILPSALMAVLDEHGFDPDTCRQIANGDTP